MRLTGESIYIFFIIVFKRSPALPPSDFFLVQGDSSSSFVRGFEQEGGTDGARIDALRGRHRGGAERCLFRQQRRAPVLAAPTTALLHRPAAARPFPIRLWGTVRTLPL